MSVKTTSSDNRHRLNELAPEVPSHQKVIDRANFEFDTLSLRQPSRMIPAKVG